MYKAIILVALGKLKEQDNLPEDLSNPTLGEVGKLSRIQEFRVEILCPENSIEIARNTLLENHPYEHPAYEFVKVKV